jgi:hypothetical protein
MNGQAGWVNRTFPQANIEDSYPCFGRGIEAAAL